ncbi:hypothetical protein BGZ63DRAFT_382103 [Mariannaea sp. PMI_226]|nr:hypothetical protein BGZ63DRAFT_382103 [Mariannaea sp. PMI_226]
MATKNAKDLINGIPSCVSGCFHNGVDAAGCNESDYDCYCYKASHQTIVDTMEVCLINRARSLGKNCTDDDMFQMQNRYWLVCEQYWEPTGTATEPASATSTLQTKSSKPVTTTAPVFSGSPASTTISELAETSASSDASDAKFQDDKFSMGAKIGVGIGISIAVIIIIAATFFWFRERRKRRVLEGQLAETRRDWETMSCVKQKGPVHEMEGDRPLYPELREARTPELMDELRPYTTSEGTSSPETLSTGASSQSLRQSSSNDIARVVTADRPRGGLSPLFGSSGLSNPTWTSREPLNPPGLRSIRQSSLSQLHRGY